MGDLSATVTGTYRKNLFQEPLTGSTELEDYANQHSSVVNQLKGTSGLNRTVAITFFNESYGYERDVRTPTGSSLMYHAVDVRGVYPEYSYLKRALDFCLRSDVCQKLGLSVADLMGLDYATFNFIEKEYYDHKPVEQEVVDQLLKDVDVKQKLKDRSK